MRDSDHSFDLCKGKCIICDKPCDVLHDWDGCTCRRCGKTRDEEHNWIDGKCSRCSKIDFDTLTDQGILADVALNSNNSVERSKAIARLEDQDALAKIVNNADNIMDIRMTAVARITKQDILAGIAGDESSDFKVRTEAISRLTVPMVIASIIMNIPEIITEPENENDSINERVRKKEEEAKIHAGYSAVTQAAFVNITDEDVINDIFNNAVCSVVRIEALSRLGNQDMLGDIAKDTGQDPAIRDAAVQRITDRRVLTGIVSSTADEVREAAVKRMTELRAES